MNVNLKQKSIYKNLLLQKGFEFAAKDGSLFMASTSLAMSTCVRPIATLVTPKTDKENRKLACSKSISSSLTGFMIMLVASIPIALGVRGIDKAPSKYLKPSTIKNLTETGKTLQESKGYQFVTQMFKLGLAFLIAAPKSIITAKFIPTVMDKTFKSESKSEKNSTTKPTKVNFKGNPVAKGIGKVIDQHFTQRVAQKFKNTNYEMHIPVITDILGTGTFVYQNSKTEKIKKEKRKILNNNALLSTGLCITGGYTLDKALQKPTERFIQKYSVANKSLPNLSQHIEGIKIAKTTFILGGIYYAVIPMLSTFFAERIPNKKADKSSFKSLFC